MNNFDLYKDPRDGEKYRVVRLNDGNFWFIDNLKYRSPGAVFIDGKTGPYYPGTEMENLAPPGWGIPKPKDWEKLFTLYGKSIKRLNEEGLNIAFEGEIRNGNMVCPSEACYWTSTYRRKGLFGINKESLLRVKFIGNSEFYIFSESPRWLAQTRCFKKA